MVVMLNTEDSAANRTAMWSEIPELKNGHSFQVVDAWTGKDLGCVKDQYRVELESHDAAVLLVRGCC
jgi:alpha-galactosidase